MYFFSVALGLCCCTSSSLAAISHRLLSSCGAWATHLRGLLCHRAWALGQWALEHRFNQMWCTGPAALLYKIILDQGLNTGLLHQQVDSFSHQGSPQQNIFQYTSVQFSHSVVSNSLQSHEPQHTRPPCSSPTPRVHSNPCPLSW